MLRKKNELEAIELRDLSDDEMESTRGGGGGVPGVSLSGGGVPGLSLSGGGVPGVSLSGGGVPGVSLSGGGVPGYPSIYPTF